MSELTFRTKVQITNIKKPKAKLVEDLKIEVGTVLEFELRIGGTAVSYARTCDITNIITGDKKICYYLSKLANLFDDTFDYIYF